MEDREKEVSAVSLGKTLVLRHRALLLLSVVVLTIPFIGLQGASVRSSGGTACPTVDNATCGERGYDFLGRCFCKPHWSGPLCEKKRFVPPCSAESDECFVTEYGVAVVSHERWLRAQEAESKLWKSQRTAVGDRVADHMLGFQNYSAVPLRLGRMIEVGCGPWTQSLWMLKLRKYSVDSITLWEPGIATYMTSMPTCSYRSGKLPGYLTILVSEGAERLNVWEQYDTLIMINVLEHVQNAFEILTNAYRSLRCGGILIFADRWFESYNYGVNLSHSLDHTFHPIRFKKVVFDHFLQHFDPLYEESNSAAFTKYKNTGVYFIGRKR